VNRKRKGWVVWREGPYTAPSSTGNVSQGTADQSAEQLPQVCIMWPEATAHGCCGAIAVTFSRPNKDRDGWVCRSNSALSQERPPMHFRWVCHEGRHWARKQHHKHERAHTSRVLCRVCLQQAGVLPASSVAMCDIQQYWVAVGGRAEKSLVTQATHIVRCRCTP